MREGAREGRERDVSLDGAFGFCFVCVLCVFFNNYATSVRLDGNTQVAQ